jgi:hypothetical protein
MTLHVPADHARIQEAVDTAYPGDLILIASSDSGSWVDRR